MTSQGRQGFFVRKTKALILIIAIMILAATACDTGALYIYVSARNSDSPEGTGENRIVEVVSEE